MDQTHSSLLSQLLEQNKLDVLTQFGMGIEREALRITLRGGLAQTPHPESLGKALTHSAITTDYAENLLEFITPVSHSVSTLLEQLSDLHYHTLKTLDAVEPNQDKKEKLWPLSMPCYVDDCNKIPLAQYGSSNVGQMKTLYRKGLQLRYGSMMQVIAGVHFNFSFPTALWQALHKVQNSALPLDEFISDKYMGVSRNFFRTGWLIPYLFGASPALSASFLKKSNTQLPFKPLAKGTCYLPYATALRLSDLGYTNQAQDCLSMSYNSLSEYIKNLHDAIALPSEHYQNLGLKKDEQYQQLSTNILQIENELYSTLRPKTVAQAGEKPSEALARGIEYIEVRSLDINPFSPLGVEADQLDFIQLLLFDALLSDSPELNQAETKLNKDNLERIILEGRKPGLSLIDGDTEVPMPELAGRIIDRLKPLAILLDENKGGDAFTSSLELQQQRIVDPDLTLSGRILKALLSGNLDNCSLAQGLAQQHAEHLLKQDYQHWDETWFSKALADSVAKQADIEASDQLSFDDFLADYFNY